MPQISEEAKVKIREQLLKKFDKALDVNALASGTPLWKALFFILDMYNSSSFYGILEWKIEGTEIKDPKIARQTFKTDCMYPDFDNF